jgi:hypothetical protein
MIKPMRLRIFFHRTSFYLTLTLIIIITCFSLSCGAPGPRAIYGSFYKALQDHNADVSWQLIDKASQQAFANTAIFLQQTGKGKADSAKDAWKWVVEQNGASNLPDPYDLTNETIDGDYAVLTFANDRMINLVREKGNWKIEATKTGK